MRRVLYPKAGPPDIIQIEEVSNLSPGKDEVVIGVHFAGINFADLMMRMGLYDAAPDFPFTPGYEVAGIIEKVGKNITSLEVGQRVGATTGFGGYAEQVCVNSKQVFPIPDKIGLDVAAAFQVTYLTAYHMLMQLGNFQSGDTVLIHHAAGGVGTAAAQLAQIFGAGKLFGVASASKSDFVISNGMRFIDREKEDFVQVVKQETEGSGVHHAIDPVGGAHLMRSYKSLRSGGKLYVFGGSSFVTANKIQKFKTIRTYLKTPKFHPMKMMSSNKSIFGVHMGKFQDFDLLKNEMISLVELLEQGKIKPIIDKSFNFEDVASAHQYLHDRMNKGKVLLKFNRN